VRLPCWPVRCAVVRVPAEAAYVRAFGSRRTARSLRARKVPQAASQYRAAPNHPVAPVAASAAKASAARASGMAGGGPRGSSWHEMQRPLAAPIHVLGVGRDWRWCSADRQV
jgi:hypothetical protein